MISKHYSPDSLRQLLYKSIDNVCDNICCYCDLPGVDFTRKRLLPARTMIDLLIRYESKAINSELADYFVNSSHLPSSSAFCQQREKLYPEALYRVFRLFTDHIDNHKTYKGYYLLACDGSDLNIPFNPDDKSTLHNQKGFKNGGYNQLHLNALYDVLNHVYQDVFIGTHAKPQEGRSLIDMVQLHNYPQKSIITSDRGYESYNLLAHFKEANQPFVVRVKDIKSRTGILSKLNLPDTEFDMDTVRRITRKQTTETKNNKEYVILVNKSGPFDFLESYDQSCYELPLRIVRFPITDSTYECLITNLSRDEFSVDDLKEIYHLRWGIENSFRELKYTIGMLNFHSRKRKHICQEIYARIILYNFSQSILNNTDVSLKEDNIYQYKIAFTSSVTLVRQYLKHMLDGDTLRVRIKKFLIPIRPGRSFKRNVCPQSTKTLTYKAA